MTVGYTDAQKQRLREFGNGAVDGGEFEDLQSRDTAFAKALSRLAAENFKGVSAMIASPKRHGLTRLVSDISDALVAEGFIEVRTPIIITKKDLADMTITEDKPLFKQVFWIDDKRALRPMLAPNLYAVMRELRGFTDGPVKIFEAGPCFRRESHSGVHLEEFTMLNLVDMGPRGDPTEVLKGHIDAVMRAAGLPDYNLAREESDVYRETIDVDIGGQEVCSAAVGPHHLDAVHGVNEPWSGAGFGLERLLMLREGYGTARKGGASLSYLNGYRINRSPIQGDFYEGEGRLGREWV